MNSVIFYVELTAGQQFTLVTIVVIMLNMVPETLGDKTIGLVFTLMDKYCKSRGSFELLEQHGLGTGGYLDLMTKRRPVKGQVSE